MKKKIVEEEKKKAQEIQHPQKQPNHNLMVEVKKDLVLPGIGKVVLDKTNHKPSNQIEQIHSSQAN